MASTLEKTWWGKPGVCWEPSWRELKLCQIASHFKRREKKKITLRRILESVFTKVVLASWRHQVPSADCLQLIFSATWQKECDRFHPKCTVRQDKAVLVLIDPGDEETNGNFSRFSLQWWCQHNNVVLIQSIHGVGASDPSPVWIRGDHLARPKWLLSR